MKIKVCSKCGSRRLALVQLSSERETYPNSDFIDNTIAVKYLCGDCSNIDEALVFNSEEELKRFLKMINGRYMLKYQENQGTQRRLKL